ncbi:DnaD domain protein [Tissierella carlieri]|jgi:DnaD/phage-associated family protein|uniref:DnaD domain protein n=1 Tax=Tissierella carlieri TaxID=689904 RepID=UPI001C0F8823|nr:DnaD domain protein [Tissierella carlieri]MBU5311883.1 DnaD domain protein [Tissierella carlieri]
MKYLTEINAFRNYLKTNSLEAITQALWYVIIDYHNSCNWERWIAIDNPRLIAELSISEKTLIKHRNKLIQAGLIEYKSQQRKKNSGKYKLLSFELGEVGRNKTTEQTTGNIPADKKADNETTGKNTADGKAEQKAVQGADWKADCSDLNRIDKTRLETNTTNISLVATAFQQNGFGTINITIKEILLDLLEQYPAEWIIEAMKVAVKANVRSLSYVEGILKKWNASGGMKLEKDKSEKDGYDPYANVEVIE